MMSNSEENGDSKFNSIQNNSFGASKLKNLQVGDLVEWNSWTISLETEVFEAQEGLLTEIFEDFRAGGPVWMAKIIPFGSEKVVIIPLITVRKTTKRN
jgi:hypothetical protein|tara:strand:- start:943 stop:1236 length:294 start_codon:yes stop_codon:yes gene_type:complete